MIVNEREYNGEGITAQRASLYTNLEPYARDVTLWSAVRAVVRVLPLPPQHPRMTSRSSMPYWESARVVASERLMTFFESSDWFLSSSRIAELCPTVDGNSKVSKETG